MSSSDMIDPGVYRAKATQGQLGKNETSGNDQPVVVFEILEGIYQGRTIRWYATLTEKTKGFVIPGLTACGWKGDIGEDGRTMIGIGANEVDIEVVHEEYQGKTNAKVRGVVTGALIAGRPMTAGEQAGFKSRWGGAIEESAAQQRAAREKRGEGSGGDDFQF